LRYLNGVGGSFTARPWEAEIGVVVVGTEGPHLLPAGHVQRL